jgi:hypothetical protein
VPETFTRRAAVALVLVAATPAAAACRAPRVLFVCPAGTVKSAIARELLTRKAAAEVVAVDIRARGLSVEDHVTPALAARLKADGIDASSAPAEALQAGDVRWADVVVAFDEAANSTLLGAKQIWRTPSWLSDYEAARRDMEIRLDGLLAELRDVDACGP